MPVDVALNIVSGMIEVMEDIELDPADVALMREAVRTLERQIGELRGALKFYAVPQHFIVPIYRVKELATIYQYNLAGCMALVDKGKVARTALRG